VDYAVEVRVGLKHGVLNAEGETVAKSLKLLGYDVNEVDAIKLYRIKIDAKSKDAAVATISEACEKLLANPVIQDYSVKVV
jgi:phosphoribosylformylglycinamidine synthase PurS subunit